MAGIDRDAGGVRQFGRPEPGRTHRDRPTAFGLATRDGKLAVVHIRKPEKAYHDLPGGAIDPGEDEPTAVGREFGEETGLRVRAGALVTRADQYAIKSDDGEAVNNRCAFYAVTIEGEDPSLKCEDDHTLVWIDPTEALTVLRHDAHAWAVLAWLRLRSAPTPGTSPRF